LSIVYWEQRKLWAIRMNASDYVFGADRHGRIQHVYWGPRLGDAGDFPDPDERISWVWEAAEGNSREELMPWGGLCFAEPGLKVEFADGTRDLNLEFTQYAVQDDQLIIEMRDASKALTVKLRYTARNEFDVLERSVEVTNDGTEPVMLEQVMGAIWHFPVYPSYRLTYLTGHWGGETQLRREMLQEGKKVIEGRRGITGHTSNPFFAVDFDDALEETGNVYYGAFAFSGHWKIVAERTPYQTLQVAAGLNDFDFRWKLAPGETFTSPVCAAGFTAEGFGGASRQFHRYQLRYVLRNADRPRPVLYNSWEATTFDVNETNQKLLAEKAAKLGVELFVIDDGWFGARNNDRAGLGDWYVNEAKFPNGLQSLIDHVISLGMDFGLWVEPEMVNPDSDLYRQHPDWVYHFPERPRTETRNQLVLNLARTEVQQFVLQMMRDLLTKYRISFIKWDMNRYFSEPGCLNAPNGRAKEMWVRHVQVVYRIWETLQREYPHVRFEACAGGGGRVDLGMMRYADQFWTSDNTDALDRLTIQWGFSHAYAAKSMMCWVTEAHNWFNGRSVPLKFRFHSAMTGALGIGMNLNHLSEMEMQETAAYIAEYKKIRPIVQDGCLYRLSAPGDANLSAVQYVSEDEHESVVFVFRHTQQFRHPAPIVRLNGLNPQTLYIAEPLQETRSGQAWMSRGIQLPLTGDYDSAIIHLRKAD